MKPGQGYNKIFDVGGPRVGEGQVGRPQRSRQRRCPSRHSRGETPTTWRNTLLK